MRPFVRRIVIWSVLAAAIGAGIVYSFRPRPVAVDVATVSRGMLRVTIDDDGETRVRHVYTLQAPLTGHLDRITADPGDPVTAGRTVLARIVPAPPSMLDTRTAAEREAAVGAAVAAKAQAAAERDRAETTLVFARTERDRARRLLPRKAISQREADDAERAFRAAEAGLAAARAALELRDQELAAARARLLPRDAARREAPAGEVVRVTAPVSGVVLRVIRRSAGIVAAGAALLDIGDPHQLEIVIDPLSEDAVRMHKGEAAIVTGWGGPELHAVIRRIDPVGRMKVSALGIEEQRVDVVLDLTDPPARWQALGDGYRVDVHVIEFEGDVLRVPLGALVRVPSGWAVYVDDRGIARRRGVTVGARGGLEAEIRTGLTPGQRVVLYPGERIRDGTRIAIRPAGAEDGS
jgi:HlyD family secretion protein